MKVLVLGLGSIGKRHLANLRAILPQVRVVGADPVALFDLSDGDAMFSDWSEAVNSNPDARAAIIASPISAHLEQAIALRAAGIPFYCEKPIGLLGELPQWTQFGDSLHCAVGYQYRFHPVYRAIASTIRRRHEARFVANDDLIDHYGPDCLSYIAAHPIDTALWLLSSAVSVDMITDGLSVRGRIKHAFGTSEHLYRIDIGPRRSIVSIGDETMSLDPCNDMYLDALSAWLAWVGGAERDERTATLADGCNALEVMGRVKHV